MAIVCAARGQTPHDARRAARDPGGDLGDARALRLLPRDGDRGDGRRRADRGRLGDRAGRSSGSLTATARRRSSTLGIAAALVGVVLASQEHQEGGKRTRRRRRRARAPRRRRLRLLLPADARCRKGRPVLGLADLPDHLDRDRPRWRSPSAGPRSGSRGWKLADRPRRRPRRHARQRSSSPPPRTRAGS